jgi:preprotein translocase subunit SecD
MDKNMAWKVGLILGVLALSVFLFVPPSKKVRLGLDLKGGSQIVMQVDTQSAVRNEVNLAVTRIGQALKDKGLDAKVNARGEGTLEIEGIDPARAREAQEVYDDWLDGWDVDDLGGGRYRAAMLPQLENTVSESSIRATLETLRERIDSLGVAEPSIQQQGVAGDRIVVLLPGLEDSSSAKNMLRDPAILEWKAVVYPPGALDAGGRWYPPTSREQVAAMFGGALPAGVELYPETRTDSGGQPVTLWWPLSTVSVVVGKDLNAARPSIDAFGQPVVSFSLTQEAGRRFERATTENLGKVMAIVLGGSKDKRVISAPTIEGTIRDQGQISGGFTRESARELALKLESGSIPVDVNIIEERTVGPSLGLDSIRKGVLASLVGYAAIMLCMVTYYRLSGLNAVVALSMNVALVLGAMCYFGATLTLPGIAGLILTAGMALDANILIFERIREELRLGRAVRLAIERGFSRAFGTIVDTHVTTLVSGAFLYMFGTGPVRGFAVTLVIGLLFSMFTAVFVSRVIYDLFVLRPGRRVESLSI